MSNVWLNYVFEESPVDNLAARMVLIVLADHADTTTGVAYPGITRIAKRSGLTIRGVKQAIKRLEEDGLVKVQRGGGRGKVSKYYLQKVHDVHLIVLDSERKTVIKGAQETVNTMHQSWPKGERHDIKGAHRSPEPLLTRRSVYKSGMDEAKKEKHPHASVYSLITGYDPPVFYLDQLQHAKGPIDEWEAFVTVYRDTPGWNEKLIPTLLRAWEEKQAKPKSKGSNGQAKCSSFGCRRNSDREAWGQPYCDACYEKHLESSRRRKRAR